MPDYIPETESALIPWFQNWAIKLPLHAGTLAVTMGEVAASAADNTAVAHVVNGRQVRLTDTQEFTAFKDEVLYSPIGTAEPTPPAPGAILPSLPDPVPVAIIARTRQLAQRVKSHPGYTVAIGEDLGIEAPAPPPPGVIKPVLTGVAQTDFQVRISWVMGGHDVLELQSLRGSEPAFSLLAYDTASPYVDTRAPLVVGQPEVRRYRARFRDNDLPVGEWSDEISITAQP